MEYCVGTSYDGVYGYVFSIVKIDGNFISDFGLFAQPEQAEDFILRFCYSDDKIVIL